GDVLLAVDSEGRGRGEDAGADRRFPEQFASLRVERVNLAVGGATVDHETATGGEHAAPVRAAAILMRPDLLASVDIPGLDFAVVIGSGNLGSRSRALRAGI